MAHILILKANEYEEVISPMFKAVQEIISSYTHTYDEIIVPGAKELPIALTLYAESLNYEAVVCIGAFQDNNEINLSYLHCQEVLRSYATYYGIPIGSAIIRIKSVKETDIENAVSYARSIGNDIAGMLQLIRQLNSLESEKYAQNRKHN